MPSSPSSVVRPLATLAVLALSGAAAHAAPVVITLDREFSGGANPTGPAPWGTATFTDTGANTVQLTLTRSSTLTSGEFIRTWLFNLAPSLNPASLSITQNSGPTAASAVRTGSPTDNAFRGDGGSFFDFKFDWPTSNTANRFDGDWVSAVFTLSMTGLNASSFIDLGVGAGNSPNGLYTAAHIQGIPPEGSGWVTGNVVIVPLPPAAWLGLGGLALAGGVASRRKQSRSLGEKA